METTDATLPVKVEIANFGWWRMCHFVVWYAEVEFRMTHLHQRTVFGSSEIHESSTVSETSFSFGRRENLWGGLVVLTWGYTNHIHASLSSPGSMLLWWDSLGAFLIVKALQRYGSDVESTCAWGLNVLGQLLLINFNQAPQLRWENRSFSCLVINSGNHVEFPASSSPCWIVLIILVRKRDCLKDLLMIALLSAGLAILWLYVAISLFNGHECVKRSILNLWITRVCSIAVNRVVCWCVFTFHGSVLAETMNLQWLTAAVIAGD